jgi:hypothetical protein
VQIIHSLMRASGQLTLAYTAAALWISIKFFGTRTGQSSIASISVQQRIDHMVADL